MKKPLPKHFIPVLFNKVDFMELNIQFVTHILSVFKVIIGSTLTFFICNIPISHKDSLNVETCTSPVVIFSSGSNHIICLPLFFNSRADTALSTPPDMPKAIRLNILKFYRKENRKKFKILKLKK